MTLTKAVSGLTFDTGSLIGIERGSSRVGAALVAARRKDWQVAVPAGALGQVWRNGAKQARLARFLATDNVEVIPLDERTAKAAGELCGRSRHTDLIDASVVICALARSHAVLTSDPDDIATLAPGLAVITV